MQKEKQKQGANLLDINIVYHTCTHSESSNRSPIWKIAENNKIPTWKFIYVWYPTRNCLNSDRKKSRESKEPVSHSKSFPIRISFPCLGIRPDPYLGLLCNISTLNPDPILDFTNPKTALFRPSDFEHFFFVWEVAYKSSIQKSVQWFLFLMSFF